MYHNSFIYIKRVILAREVAKPEPIPGILCTRREYIPWNGHQSMQQYVLSRYFGVELLIDFFFCALKIVGVCTEELQAAQQWNGQGILDLLRGVRV